MTEPNRHDAGDEDARALAERAGADAALVRLLIDAKLVSRGADGTFADGAARRVRVIGDLVRSGIPATLLVESLRAGTLNMDFVEQPSYDRYSAYEPETFEDVSRQTEEHGDASAADLAGRVARLVQRVSAEHGGRTVKWLGDGLMVYHPDVVGAVDAALDLLDEIGREQLPPAHVGIHAGPVIYQEGDYFGRTVNTAARIAAHAGSGQILASEEVAAACRGKVGAAFDQIGPVDLKGLVEPLVLFAAHRSG